MKLFTVKLTEDERAKLEAHRVRLGLRSQSDVIRHWIDGPKVDAVAAYFEEARREDIAVSALTNPGIVSETRGVQFGPSSSRPGSRLRVEKERK